VDAKELTGGVHVADADGRVLERAAEPLLAVAQLRDVGAGAEPFDDIPAGVADRYATRLEPSILAALVANAVFDVVGVVPRDRFPPEKPRRFGVVGWQR